MGLKSETFLPMQGDHHRGFCFHADRWAPALLYNQAKNNKLNLQAELFLPDWVQVAVDGLCSLLGLPNLDRDIRVTGARPVLGLETLCTDDWSNTHRDTHKQKEWLWKLHKNNKTPTRYPRLSVSFTHTHTKTQDITHMVTQSLVTHNTHDSQADVG